MYIYIGYITQGICGKRAIKTQETEGACISILVFNKYYICISKHTTLHSFTYIQFIWVNLLTVHAAPAQFCTGNRGTVRPGTKHSALAVGCAH